MAVSFFSLLFAFIVRNRLAQLGRLEQRVAPRLMKCRSSTGYQMGPTEPSR